MISSCPPLLRDTDPRLRQVSAPVSLPDPALAGELAALHATLAGFRALKGFGRAIAAPQLGIMKRAVAMNLGATPFALINPRITWHSNETFELWDDCLSLPEHIVRVRRYQSVSVQYQDEYGRVRHWHRLPQDMAELVQHELDHLDGILMTDRQTGADAIQPIAKHSQLIGAARPAHRIALNRIKRAQQIIPKEFQYSPQYECEALSTALGCKLTLKLDFANPIRSFKGRGASFFVSEGVARGDKRPIIAASAGNFGQAMAYACREHNIPITVFASVNATPIKIERMRELGTQVVLQGHDFDAAKLAAKEYALRIGGRMVEDGLEVEISEGHGTIAIELLAYGDTYDAIAIPLGNGALLNGMACWFKAAAPCTQVIGVSAAGADAMERSWRSGQIAASASVDTIADGIAVRVPIPEAVQDMKGVVDDVLLVEDKHIVEAMRLVYRYADLLLEPAGAVGVAAILANPQRFAGLSVATVLSGSNVTEPQIEEYFRAKGV